MPVNLSDKIVPFVSFARPILILRIPLTWNVTANNCEWMHGWLNLKWKNTNTPGRRTVFTWQQDLIKARICGRAHQILHFTCLPTIFGLFSVSKVWFLLNQCKIFSYWFFHIACWIFSPLRQDYTLDNQQSTALPWWFLRNWHHITKLALISPLNEILIRSRSY